MLDCRLKQSFPYISKNLYFKLKLQNTESYLRNTRYRDHRRKV